MSSPFRSLNRPLAPALASVVVTLLFVTPACRDDDSTAAVVAPDTVTTLSWLLDVAGEGTLQAVPEARFHIVSADDGLLLTVEADEDGVAEVDATDFAAGEYRITATAPGHVPNYARFDWAPPDVSTQELISIGLPETQVAGMPTSVPEGARATEAQVEILGTGHLEVARLDVDIDATASQSGGTVALDAMYVASGTPDAATVAFHTDYDLVSDEVQLIAVDVVTFSELWRDTVEVAADGTVFAELGGEREMPASGIFLTAVGEVGPFDLPPAAHHNDRGTSCVDRNNQNFSIRCAQRHRNLGGRNNCGNTEQVTVNITFKRSFSITVKYRGVDVTVEVAVDYTNNETVPANTFRTFWAVGRGCAYERCGGEGGPLACWFGYCTNRTVANACSSGGLLCCGAYSTYTHWVVRDKCSSSWIAHHDRPCPRGCGNRAAGALGFDSAEDDCAPGDPDYDMGIDFDMFDGSTQDDVSHDPDGSSDGPSNVPTNPLADLDADYDADPDADYDIGPHGDPEDDPPVFDLDAATPDAAIPDAAIPDAAIPDVWYPDAEPDADVSIPDAWYPDAEPDADVAVPDVWYPDAEPDADVSIPDVIIPDAEPDADVVVPDLWYPDGTPDPDAAPWGVFCPSGTDAECYPDWYCEAGLCVIRADLGGDP